MLNNPCEFDLAALIAKFDLEEERELEQLQERLDAATLDLRQVDVQYTFPTFEEMFAADLELDRQAEQAWIDKMDKNTRELDGMLEEIFQQSRKWHNLARAAGANIFLHIVNSNYSEENYRQLPDVPELALGKYTPIKNPDDQALLGICLDFGSPGTVKLNVSNAFIELAQTKQFTLETPHEVSIDELHVRALVIKQFAQIRKPESIISLTDFIDLAANGVIIVGKVTAGNQIKFYSPDKIAASLLKSVNCELHSLSDIKVKKLLGQQLIKATAPHIDIKQAISLDKLYFAGNSLVAQNIAAQLVSIKSKKIDAKQIVGTQLVNIEADKAKVKLIASFKGAGSSLGDYTRLFPEDEVTKSNIVKLQSFELDKVKVNCSGSLEVDRIQAKDCNLTLGECLYNSHTFEGVTDNLILELKGSNSVTQQLNANQLHLIHLWANHPLVLNAGLNIQHKLIINAVSLKQNQAICAGRVEFNIHNCFDSNAPITARHTEIKASQMQQSFAGDIQGDLLKINVNDGDFYGRCRVKKLQLTAKDSLQYLVSKWQADNYEIRVPEPRYAKFPATAAGDYSLTITRPNVSDKRLSIEPMQLGGQLTVNASQCHIAIVRANKIVAKFILINGERIRLFESGLFGMHGVTLSAADGFSGLQDGTYIRTAQGDIKLISEGNQINLADLEILTMLSGNIFLRARDGVSDISGKLQTVHGDVIVQSPSLSMGLIYHQLQSESRGNNLTRTGGVKVTSRPAELVAKRLILSGFNPGEHCVARFTGCMCYLQELPKNRESIQTETIVDHENFYRTWTYTEVVDHSERRYLIMGPRKPEIAERHASENTTTTHATYTAELVISNNAHVNLTREDHSGLILSAGQNTIHFDSGTVFNPTPKAASGGPFLNVSLDEVINLPSSGGFYTFVTKLSAKDFMVPELGNRYSFYVPAVEIPYEEKYPMIAGLDRYGKLQIMPRRSVWMYHHLGQELENFHLILHKQYAASLSIMPNPEILYWKACHNGAVAVSALQREYAGDPITLEKLEADLIAGSQYVVFYQEQLEPTTSEYAWFMRSIMPMKMYKQLRDNFGSSGIYGENILLCGVNSQASIKLRDDLKAKALLDLQTGHVEFSANKVTAQNIIADLDSLSIDDAEVAATVDIGIVADFLSISRQTAAKINLSAGNDIGLKASQFSGTAASFDAGHDLTTLFIQSDNKANPLQTSDGSVIHLLPKLSAGNSMLWQVAQKSLHEAPQIKAKRFKEIAGEPIYLAVSDVHRKSWNTQEKSGWGPFKQRKEVQHVSIDVISRGAQFDVEETVEIVADMGIRLQQVQSFAGKNIFVAPDATVDLLAGTNQHQCQTLESKRNLVWQKHTSESISSKDHTPCKFSGEIKIISRSAYIELLANNLESQRLKGQVEQGLEGELMVQYLHAAYEYHCEKQQGPTAAAAVLIAIAITVLTQGTGAQLVGALGAQASVGAGSVAAAMIDAALCSTLTTATLNLANNGGDIGKAVKALGKSENIRNLLTSVATAGITAKFIEPLKQSIEPLKQSKSGLDAVLQVEQTADLLTKVQDSLVKAGVQFSMSQLIEKGEHRTKFAAALGGAVAGAVAEHLDFSICAKASMDKGIDAVAAKISKAVIGGLGASVFVGKRAFLGGALGALVADLDVLAMNEADLNPQNIARHAKATGLLAGFGSLLLKQDVNAAASAASRVAENRAYARVLHNKLQDIALAKEAMLDKAKELQNRGEDGEDDVATDEQELNLEELLRDSGLSEENIDELEKLITEHNKDVVKATMQTEQDNHQDLGVTFDQKDATPPDSNLLPPPDGPPNPPDSGVSHEQSASSSNAIPGAENQQESSVSRDKDDKTEQKNANKPGLFFSSDAKGINHTDNSASSSSPYEKASADKSVNPGASLEQQKVDSKITLENKQYSKENIALQKTCKIIARTLEPHVDRIGKFVEDHPYAMDAINLVMLTAALSAGGIPGVLMMSLKSSIVLAGEDAAKNELVSRGVAAKDAAIVVGAIALSLGAKSMFKGGVKNTVKQATKESIELAKKCQYRISRFLRNPFGKKPNMAKPKTGRTHGSEAWRNLQSDREYLNKKAEVRKYQQQQEKHGHTKIKDGTVLSTKMELEMAEHFAERGHQVSMRPAKGSQPGGVGHREKTSDLFIDNVKYEIYSPEPGTPAKNMISTLAKKEEQSTRFIVSLDNSNVTKKQLGNVIGRLRGTKNNTVQEVIFIKNNEIFHQALAHEAEVVINYSPKP